MSLATTEGDRETTRVGLDDGTTDGEEELVMDGALETRFVGVALGPAVEGCEDVSCVGPIVVGLSVDGSGVVGTAVVGAAVSGTATTGAAVVGTGVLGIGATVGSGCFPTGADVDTGARVGWLVASATGAGVGF